jgi:hypothetical protein
MALNWVAESISEKVEAVLGHSLMGGVEGE